MMKVSVIGLKTEKTGDRFDDKDGMIVQEVCHQNKRAERENHYRGTLDYRSNVRVREFELLEDKKWFLIKKEHDAYDITVRMWSYSKQDLEDCLDDSLIVVDEKGLFERLTELV